MTLYWRNLFECWTTLPNCLSIFSCVRFELIVASAYLCCSKWRIATIVFKRRGGFFSDMCVCLLTPTLEGQSVSQLVAKTFWFSPFQSMPQGRVKKPFMEFGRYCLIVWYLSRFDSDSILRLLVAKLRCATTSSITPTKCIWPKQNWEDSLISTQAC